MAGNQSTHQNVDLDSQVDLINFHGDQANENFGGKKSKMARVFQNCQFSIFFVKNSSKLVKNPKEPLGTKNESDTINRSVF